METFRNNSISARRPGAFPLRRRVQPYRPLPLIDQRISLARIQMRICQRAVLRYVVLHDIQAVSTSIPRRVRAQNRADRTRRAAALADQLPNIVRRGTHLKRHPAVASHVQQLYPVRFVDQ
jgi:hypothetical protein